MASKNNANFSGINFNDLSATSSAFMSNIKQNSMKGGRPLCPCMQALNAFNKNNMDLALYIINQGVCCLGCGDKNGNTILHHLVLCSKKNKECEDTIDMLIKNNSINQYIDLQNNKGETPILLAIKEENNDLANKLDLAGADLTIKDNSGNYVIAEDENANDFTNKTLETSDAIFNLKNLFPKSKNTMDTSIDSFDFETDIKPQNKSSNFINTNEALTKYFKDFIKSVGVGKIITDRKQGDDIVYVPLRETQPGPESDIQIIDINSPLNDTQPEESKSEVLKSDTDNLIQKLAEKYSNEEKGKKEKFDVNTINSDVVDTEDLMRAINKLNETGKVTQQGGEKIMGFRNLTLSDNSFASESFNINYNTDSEQGISEEGYVSFYNESDYGAVTNELSRMMQRQRDNLHEQVLDMIMSMLNKGEIVKDSVVIKANEKNAKLIKAYIYRKVTEKNPQMGGLDKILSISKMSEQQISDLIEDMPDLDELEKNIQKHIEEKKGSKKSIKSKKSKKSDESEETNFDITETSDSPKKKSSKSKTTKTKVTKTKKTSKKKSKK